MEQHPNRTAFKGVLCYVDRPSERAPNGSRGRRVILTRDAATAALPSIIGMAVNFTPDWNAHDIRKIAGVITDAWIDGDLIRVRGFIYGINFPELVEKLRKEPDKMGMSYELHNAHVVDMRRAVWQIKQATFTGAAITLRGKCAYAQTSVEIDDQVIPSIAAIAAIETLATLRAQ